MSEEEEPKTFIDASQASSTPPANRDRNENEKGGKSRDGLYIIIILLLLLGGGYLGWLMSEKNKALNDCSNEKLALETELVELNEMMHDEGLAIGDNVMDNLRNMMSMYEQMEVTNADMADSIQAQKDKISGLMLELEDAKSDRSHYLSKVYKLQKETETLRSIMKDYIRTIDSLNMANAGLTQDLSNTQNQLSNTQNQLSTTQNELNDMTDKVNKGSKLNAFGFTTEGIKEKSSGSYKEVDRASACTHIRSCFTIGDNAIASKGNRTVYMRIITPGGSVLYESNNNTFKTDDGQSLLYSDKKTINYQNQSVDVCVFHKLSQEIAKGNYIAQIYCDGVLIGTDKFVLK